MNLHLSLSLSPSQFPPSSPVPQKAPCLDRPVENVLGIKEWLIGSIPSRASLIKFQIPICARNSSLKGKSLVTVQTLVPRSPLNQSSRGVCCLSLSLRWLHGGIHPLLKKVVDLKKSRWSWSVLAAPRPVMVEAKLGEMLVGVVLNNLKSSMPLENLSLSHLSIHLHHGLLQLPPLAP